MSSDAVDLPFLVTHWLSSYSTETNNDERKEEALMKVRKAAAELASSFAILGEFGTKVTPGLARGDFFSTARIASATFADLKRTWSTCPPEQLEYLLQSSQSAGKAADAIKASPPHLIRQATEAIIKKRKNPQNGGRTLEDLVHLEMDQSTAEQSTPWEYTVHQKPILLASETIGKPVITATELAKRSSEASESMKKYLDFKQKCNGEEQQLRSLKRSAENYRRMLDELNQQRMSLVNADGIVTVATRLQQLDDIKENEANCVRVFSQLQRQISAVEAGYIDTLRQVCGAKEEARAVFIEFRRMRGSFRSPAADKGRPNRVLVNIWNRQLGLGHLHGKITGRCIGRERTLGLVREMRLSILFHRLSHAATINTHLSYPVYCLRFDRTGRYFISGADDYLVRVFCLGSNTKVNASAGVGARIRGAVLVCTLRGHAGVINNIDVSPDNSFLATASEDGDVRVWGLKDGSPIAILRGHKGGANTVVWSPTIPFRLVTAGGDGLARSWDIRDACLKRYGKIIGKRPEYRLQRPADASVDRNTSVPTHNRPGENLAENSNQLPIHSFPIQPLAPIPAADAGGADRGTGDIPPPLPPLPVPDDDLSLPPIPLGDGDNARIHAVAEESGRFVANDSIDEGVVLLTKLHHGAPREEQMNEPGTRSRRVSVKVLCVAGCPYGRHFATGADDGICRIWKEDEDTCVDLIDKKYSNWPIVPNLPSSRPSPSSNTGEPLLTLKGHLSAITDLDYSHKGDRLLSASQKDGVVRIWTWEKDPVEKPNQKTSHILIKLSNPRYLEKEAATFRRRPTRCATSNSYKISCDVAVWSKDDKTVITSQSELEKQSGSEIVPGSQYIFIWNSYSGDCLLGISDAHTMQCPVIIPHPIDANVLCSAGADGFAKVWDLSNGTCTSSFSNTLEFGPIDIRDKGKPCGFLDGAFSPDGTTMILSDDSGRISVYDCPAHCFDNTDIISGHDVSWLKEQYFSNDYYDLHYDQHGYCVERGSEMPPHLAPRGVRCSNSGSPWGDNVDEAFRGTVGPLPIDEASARWARQNLRGVGRSILERNLQARGNMIGRFDPQTTVLVGQGGEVVDTMKVIYLYRPPERVRDVSENRMSSNYRWRDYSDMIREEATVRQDDMELDSDEEFQIDDSTSRVLHDNSDSEDEINATPDSQSPVRYRSSRSRVESEDDDSPVRPRRSCTGRTPFAEVPARASSRQRRRAYIDTDSETEEEYVEYMSTNNEPSGPFATDYENHFFRITDARSHAVERAWVRRLESNSSYCGRKSYTPQVGDTVAYIPRAHYDTISEYPILTAPWHSWPENSAWPVVRCVIRNIRYRFPFKAYFGRNKSSQVKCASIVAILTLEITGVPIPSCDRQFNWPAPVFAEPASSHVFEVSLFENAQADYILPIGLYATRFKNLEEAFLSETQSSMEIEAYYKEGNHEDAELTAFRGKAESFVRHPETGAIPHLNGSGYRTVTVLWNDSGDMDALSPWEIDLRGHDPEPCRVSLTDNEKRRVRESLKKIRDIDGVSSYFSYPVNEVAYSDYRSRIEVPMDLTFIANRLHTDYYSSLMSVVADVKLIKDNCLKYNGDNDETSRIAQRMLVKCEELLLEEEDLAIYRAWQAEVESSAQCRSEVNPEPLVINEQRQVDTTNLDRLVGQTARIDSNSRSSLENLAPPSSERPSMNVGADESTAVLPATIRSLRRSRRSVLETMAVNNRTLEDLSSSGRGTRGRRVQNRGGAHRSLRSSQQPLETLMAPGAESDTRNMDLASRHSAVEGNVGQNGTDQVQRESRSRLRLRIQAPPERSSSRRTRSTLRESSSHNQPLAPSRPQRGATTRSGSSGISGERVRPGFYHEESSDDDESFNERGNSRKNQRRAQGYSRRQENDSDHDTSDGPEQESNDEATEVYMEEEEDDDDISSTVESSSDESSRSSTKIAKKTVRKEETGKGSQRSQRSQTTRREPVSPVPARKSPRAKEVVNRESVMASTFSNRRTTRASSGTSNKRGRASYEDPSSSEFGTDIEDESAPVNKAKAAKTAPKKRPKRETANSEASSPPIWPDIPVKMITLVSKDILERLKAVDEDGLFAEPVTVTHPELAKEYLSIIEEPMDFRTIEEERLLRYTSIQELQQDLMLVFNNCMAYNEGENSIHSSASSMLFMLADIFDEVCKLRKIRLPRKWKDTTR